MSNHSDNSIRITRGQLGQVSSGIGFLGLLVTLIGFIWQGGLTPFIIGAFVFGIAGLGLWAYLLPSDFRAFFTGRQARQGTIAIFMTVLLLAIVTVTYILAQREVIVIDITVDQRFSLSSESLDVIEATKRSPQDIEITAFYYANQIVAREIDDQYWQLYEDASDGKIRRRYIDPNAQPAFAERYISAISQGYNVFVSFVNDDGTLDLPSTVPVAQTGRQEADMTQALARLLARGQFKVYFEQGLETLDPLDNENQQGMAIANGLLRTNGIITEPVSLVDLVNAGRGIPQDASALILARPRRQLEPQEIQLIDQYLASGGALFIAADVFFVDQTFLAAESTFNQYLWEHFGLRMMDAVAVDPVASGQTQLDVASYAVYGNNAIGANLNLDENPNTTTLFNLARAIEVSDEPPVTNGSVILTSEASWGETDLEALSQGLDPVPEANEDIPGPLVTVAWAHNQETDAKIVLIGDGNFLTNSYIQAPEGNATLLLDSIGWMTGFSEAVEFSPRVFNTTPLMFVDGQMLDTILFITAVLMPGTMLAAAGGIWFARRRR